MTMTKNQYMRWCKERALEYLDRGDLKHALASFIGDVTAHDETRDAINPATLMLATAAAENGDSREMRRWIEGFAE